MTKSIVFLALAAVIAGVAAVGNAIADDKPATTAPAATDKPAALNFTVKDIDGKDVDLSTYKGKVVMILNVASLCGNTPQYTALEALYKKYSDKGFVIIGFPANNFGSQEPGTNAEIKEFCTADSSQYHITFPLMSKVSVKGKDIAPLFKYLTDLDSQPVKKGEIAWNFEKFLISRDGKLVNRFANRMQPDNPMITSAIERELNAK